MNTKWLLPVALTLLATFGGFSTYLVIREGYTGFLHLAARDPWGLQMLLDVTIASTVACLAWVVPDARARGIPAWPYLVTTVFLGSIGILAYAVHREVARAT